MAKTRVAPLQSPIIPKMELTAATVSIKMDKLLKTDLELELHDSIFSDSNAVLKYLDSESTRFKIFVAKRISAILEQSQTSWWRYINNTTLNPTDEVSREQTIEAFWKNESWLSGPGFLLCKQDQWPKNPDPATFPDNKGLVCHEVKVKTQTNELCQPIPKLFLLHESEDDWWTVLKPGHRLGQHGKDGDGLQLQGVPVNDRAKSEKIYLYGLSRS